MITRSLRPVKLPRARRPTGPREPRVDIDTASLTAADQLRHRVLEHDAARDQAPPPLLELENAAGSKAQPSPEPLGNRHLPFLADDGSSFHTQRIGIPTPQVKLAPPPAASRDSFPASARKTSRPSVSARVVGGRPSDAIAAAARSFP